GLLRQPLDQVVAVGLVAGVEDVKIAFGVVTPSKVGNSEDIASFGEPFGARRPIPGNRPLVVVWCVLQNNRKLTRRIRAVHIHREPDPISHRNHRAHGYLLPYTSSRNNGPDPASAPTPQQ